MSGAVARLYTFTDGTDAIGSQVEAEFNTLFNNFNNLDAGTSSWTTVKTGILTTTGVTTIKGSATNDAAAAGNVGEYIESVTTFTNFGATTVISDLTNISLTAGDWDVSFNAQADPASVGTFTAFDIGISATSGNSSTGLTAGSNRLTAVGSTSADTTATIAAFRVSVASTTTYYAKIVATYSGGSGTPRIEGRLSARRVR